VSSLLVTECIGPTFQHRGPSVGQLAMVIRLPERPTGGDRRFDTELLARWAIAGPARLVVITGGEPLRQPDELIALTSRLAGLGQRVEIETQGSSTPPGELLAAGPWFVVSLTRHTTDAALATFAEADRVAFRATGHTTADITELARLEQLHSLYPIWLDAEHDRALRWAATQALTHGWNLSTRLGVAAFRP
jgi:7-carboxy-7-deazaguanine synthase